MKLGFMLFALGGCFAILVLISWNEVYSHEYTHLDIYEGYGCNATKVHITPISGYTQCLDGMTYKQIETANYLHAQLEIVEYQQDKLFYSLLSLGVIFATFYVMTREWGVK